MKKIIVLCLFVLGTIVLSSCQSSDEFPYLDAQVTIEGNVFMSLDQKQWKTTLTSQDFNTLLTNKYSTFEFFPVTTETGRLPFYEITETEALIAHLGFYEIPIYFRSENLNYIQWKSVALSSLPITWNPSVDFRSGASQIEAGDEIQASIVNAIRVSISGTIGGDVHSVVYERPQGYHHNHVLGSGGDLSADGVGVPGFLSYYFAHHQQLLFGAENVSCAPTITQVRESAQIMITELEHKDDQYEGHIVLRIWIERWDPDSYPVVYDGKFSLSMVFMGKRID